MCMCVCVCACVCVCVCRLLTVNMDYTITLVLATALIIKYILFDNDVDQHLQTLLEKEKSERKQDDKVTANGAVCGDVKVFQNGIPPVPKETAALESKGVCVCVCVHVCGWISGMGFFRRSADFRRFRGPGGHF